MLLLFGWKAIFGAILCILSNLKNHLINTNEEGAIMLIKNFIKEGNIDFDSFFKDMHYFKISDADLKSLGKKFYQCGLPDRIIAGLANQAYDFDIFLTYDNTHIEKIDLSGNYIEKPNFIKSDEYTKIEKSHKERKRDKNRVPRKFDSKQKQMRMSSENHYKPIESIRSPIPIQMNSDDENDIKSVEKLPFTEEGKFMIPNEGNINKSPMSLFTKATRENAFCTSSDDIREKSLSFNAYAHMFDGKRSTTPQHKDFLYSNLIDHQKVNFESVKPKLDNLQKYKVNVKNIDFIIDSASKRSQTIKARPRHQNYPISGGTYIKSNMPSGIGQVRQSLDHPLGNEPEDFIVGDTDERVTSHK